MNEYIYGAIIASDLCVAICGYGHRRKITLLRPKLNDKEMNDEEI